MLTSQKTVALREHLQYAGADECLLLREQLLLDQENELRARQRIMRRDGQRVREIVQFRQRFSLEISDVHGADARGESRSARRSRGALRRRSEAIGEEREQWSPRRERGA